jgi:hypothetical protein
MKSTMIAALVVLFLSVASAAFARASGTEPVHAPITISSGLDVSRATVTVAINGQSYACVLDTGTSTMMVSRAVAYSAGLSAEEPVDEISPDGLRYADQRTHLGRFSVAGYTMRDVPALISSKLPGTTVLCGYDFFASIPTVIDRDRQAVTLFPGTAALDAMHCLPVDLTPRVPVATLEINGAWVDRIVLDSGMVGGGVIWNGIADRLPPPLPTTTSYQPDPGDLQRAMNCGFNATIGLFNGSPRSFVPMCTSSQRPDGYNGIIEMNLPTVHRLAIDYPNRRVCFSTGPPMTALR